MCFAFLAILSPAISKGNPINPLNKPIPVTASPFASGFLAACAEILEPTITARVPPPIRTQPVVLSALAVFKYSSFVLVGLFACVKPGAAINNKAVKAN